MTCSGTGSSPCRCAYTGKGETVVPKLADLRDRRFGRLVALYPTDKRDKRAASTGAAAAIAAPRPT